MTPPDPTPDGQNMAKRNGLSIPDLTPEQVIAESLGGQDPDSVYVGDARRALAALRAAGHPVGWDDVRERLLSEGAVEAASRDFEPATWAGFDAGLNREFERTDALADAETALDAAISHAEEHKD